MRETSARLLLLLSLLQARREWAGSTLADRLAVSMRTVRRDVDRLRALGYPVSVTKGPGSSYRLDAGADLPPLLFDDEQAVAVALALQTAPTTVAGIDDAAARALTTIRQVMPARLRHQIDAVEITAVGSTRDPMRPQVDPKVLVAVGTAMRNREVLRFDYASAPDHADARHDVTAFFPPRRVEPHHLVMWSARWYLVAWDLDRADWRTFRVDRLTPRFGTGPRFDRRELPADDVGHYVTRQFDRGSTRRRWPCQGFVELDAPATLVARWAPEGATVEETSENTCTLGLGAWSWVGLAALVSTFAADFEVMGPPELAAACVELAERYAAAGHRG
ncbi:putative DNA-binding transcriptional regulator YafY [Nakamurella sp. UYEF19]|uniref:helix-turn-helix transcriptional regulator n=1 Tax=Nakamurella sp. UYEF19 TaxID=1756392 RepID=UPI0033965F58